MFYFGQLNIQGKSNALSDTLEKGVFESASTTVANIS